MHIELETHMTLDDLRGFLEGNAEGAVLVPDRKQAYEHIGQVLQRFSYWCLGKADKGLLRRYLARTTGISRAQLARLIARYIADGKLVDRRKGAAKPRRRKYGRADILLLAETDELHGTLSGPATLEILRRGWKVFGDARFERLAELSNGHLYNLRRSTKYLQRMGEKDATGLPQVAVEERRPPRPEGLPGYLRVDSVHQGDLDRVTGVYQIDVVDEVTQFQFVGSVERISEDHLVTVLESLLESFPFRVRGFHSANESEYASYRVAGLLEELRVGELTESGPPRSKGNALVNSENRTVVRKHLGCGQPLGRCAERMDVFNREVLLPYLNYHRPCYFPSEEVDANGTVRKLYRRQDLMTPYEKLKSLPGAEACLRPGIDFASLEAQARVRSDNEAARRLNEARDELFAAIRRDLARAA